MANIKHPARTKDTLVRGVIILVLAVGVFGLIRYAVTAPAVLTLP